MKTEGLPRNSASQEIIFFSVRGLTPRLRFFSVAREGRDEEAAMRGIELKNRLFWGVLLMGCMTLTAMTLAARQSGTVQDGAPASGAVPNLIRYSGVLRDASGAVLTTLSGVTFLIYRDEQGGPPLWMETQNVQPDKAGRYTVQLGAVSKGGLPADVFMTGEARWLAVQVAQETEQARVPLVAVPYAMKAADAQTLGGLPASAFVLAAPSAGNAAASSAPSGSSTSTTPPPPAPSNVTTNGGAANTIPLFTTATDIENSILTQTGTTAINVGGTLNLPATGTATAIKGFNSQAQRYVASAFNSTASAAVPQTFQWQAEPVNNDKSTARGTLNLLYAMGTATPAETGLRISNKGVFTFATGQTFPGTGTGTVTSVTAGAGLAGGIITNSGTISIPNAGVTNAMLQNSFLTVNPGTALVGGGAVFLGGSTTLNLDTSKVPLLAANNIFTGNQTVNGNLSATGVVTGSSYQIGSNLFAFGSFANSNAFLGFAGNTSTTSFNNTASGVGALFHNTTGGTNTASGANALLENTTGNANTASGFDALFFNTTGAGNTASGQSALQSNSTGSDNTASGVSALFSNTIGNNNTASGVSALLHNTTGAANTASGDGALLENTTGNANTAGGFDALVSNTTGTNNTASGHNSGSTIDSSSITGSNNTFLGFGSAASTGTLNNATAIGANAEVDESNATVLGSISGVNFSSANTLVGIGITAPTALLHIGNTGGPPASTWFLRVEGPATSGTGASAVSVGGDGVFGIDAPGVTNGRFVVYEQGTGLVGINTPSPDATLSVNGTADKPGGGSWGTFSDGRLKDVDGSFHSGLEQVLKLRPVRYRYKEDNALGISDHEEHIGVVAQEVQRVLPEAVSENNKGYLLVNNDPIIWAMLNAIKEQQQEIKALRKQAVKLESKLKELQKQRGQIEVASVK
jgi:hypothetical protein